MFRCVEGKCQLESEISIVTKNEPTEFGEKSIERLRQKTRDFYKPKSHKSLKLEVVDVKELSKTEKISRFM